MGEGEDGGGAEGPGCAGRAQLRNGKVDTQEAKRDTRCAQKVLFQNVSNRAEGEATKTPE